MNYTNQKQNRNNSLTYLPKTKHKSMSTTEPKSCFDFHTNICKMNKAIEHLLIRKKILTEICAVFMINEWEISSDSRVKTYVIPRMFYSILCKELAEATLKSIADDLGGRDHTTIISSIKAAKNLIKSDMNIKKVYRFIRGKVLYDKSYDLAASKELVSHLFRDPTTFDKREKWQSYHPSYKVRKRIETMLKKKEIENHLPKKTRKEILAEYEAQFSEPEPKVIHLPDTNGYSYKSHHA